MVLDSDGYYQDVFAIVTVNIIFKFPVWPWLLTRRRLALRQKLKLLSKRLFLIKYSNGWLQFIRYSLFLSALQSL